MKESDRDVLWHIRLRPVALSESRKIPEDSAGITVLALHGRQEGEGGCKGEGEGGRGVKEGKTTWDECCVSAPLHRKCVRLDAIERRDKNASGLSNRGYETENPLVFLERVESRQ